MMSLRRAYTFGLMSLILLPLQAFGQGYVVDNGVSDPSGSIHEAILPVAFGGPFDNGYFWARGDFGDRPGANGNFFTTGVFAPIQIYGPEELFFIQGQMWVSEHSNVGGDVGIGNRWLIRDYSQAVGLNAFITWDKSQSETRYRQFGFGAEWMTDYLEVTSNVYLPWKERTVDVGPPVITNQRYFTGQHLAFLNFQNVEQQSTGFDIEVGSPIPGMEFLSVYGGFYHFDFDDTDNATGVSGRATLDLTNAMLGINVQDDSRFGTTVSGFAELRLGNGPLHFVPRYRNLMTKVREQVRRRQFIATQQFIEQRDELAINPTTGNPYTFAHVDNTAAPGGDGTFETMYDNLSGPSGSAVDIILVHRGTTDSGTLLEGDGGLFLTDNQIVLGEGQVGLPQGTVLNGQIFINADPAVQLITTNRPNPIDLPGWDTTGDNPFVTADAGANIINLADNNVIVGLNMISPAGGTMIRGEGITDFFIADINQNIGAGDTGPGGGIHLTDTSGMGVITGFNMRSTDPTSVGGIVVDNTSTDELLFVVEDVDFMTGSQYGVSLTADDSVITGFLNEVNADGNGNAIHIDATNDADVFLRGTAMSGADSELDAIFIEADDSIVELQLIDAGSFANAGTGGSGHGINFTANNDSIVGIYVAGVDGGPLADFTGAADNGVFGNVNNSSGTLILVDADFSDNGNNGLEVLADAGSSFGIGLDNVLFDNSGDLMAGTGNAIRLDAQGGSLLTVEGIEVSGLDAAENGILATASGANSRINILRLDDSDFSDAGERAIALDAEDGSRISLIGDGLSGARAGLDAIGLMADDARIDLVLTGAGDFSNAGQLADPDFGSGVNFVALNGAEINIGIAGTPGDAADFSGANINGILGHLELNPFEMPPESGTGGSNVTIELADVNFSGAGQEGFGVSAFEDSTLTLTAQDVDFSGAQNSNGIRLNLDDSTGTMTLTNVDASDNNANGLLVDAVAASQATMTLDNVLFNNSGDLVAGTGDAIRLNAIEGSEITLTGTGVSGEAASRHGIFLTADDLDSDIDFTLTQTGSFAGAGAGTVEGDGIRIEATTGANIDATVAGTMADLADFTGALDNGVFASFNDATGSLTLANADFSGNGNNGLEVQAAAGAVVDQVTLTNVLFNNSGDLVAGTGDAIRLNAVTGSEITLSGTGVSGEAASRHGIFLTAEDADSNIDFTLTQTGSFAGAGAGTVEGDGIRIEAITESNIDATVAGTMADLADFIGALDNGVFASFNDATGSLTLANADFSGNGNNGLEVQAAAGAVVDQVTLTNVLFNNSGDLVAGTGDAIRLNAVTGSEITLSGTGVSGEAASRHGIFLTAEDADSNIDFTLTQTGSFAGAGAGTVEGDGIRIEAITESNIDATVAGTLADLADFTGALDNGAFASFNDATGELTLINADFSGAQNGDAISLNTENGSELIVNGSNLSGAGAARHGIHVDSEDSVMHVALTNVDDFSEAGVDGINITVDGGTFDDFSFALSGTALNPANFSEATNDGLNVTFNNHTGFDAVTPILFINNANFDEAGNNGFTLTSNGTTPGDESSFHGLVTNSSFDQAGNHAVEAVLSGNDPESTLTFQNTDLTNATVDGVNVALTDNTTFNLNIQNSDLTGAGNNAVDFTTDATSTFNLVINPTPIQADNNGINGLMNGGTANISITGATGGTPIIAGNNGVNLELENGAVANLNITDAPIQAGHSGIVLDLDASTAGLLLTDSGIVFDTDEDGDGHGLHVTGINGSFLNGGPSLVQARLTRSAIDGDGNGEHGVFLDLDDSTATINFLQGSTVTNAGSDNLHVDALNGSTANLVFSPTSGTLDNAGQNGIFLNADGTGSQIDALFEGALNLDDSGTDGLSLNASNDGHINFTAINGLSIDDAGNNAINIVGDGGSFDVNLRRNSSEVASLDRAGEHGIRADLRNESDLNFRLQGFRIDQSNGHGISLELNADSTAQVQLINGVVSNSNPLVDPDNPGHGIFAATNNDPVVTGDSSFLTLDLLNVDLLNNNGDGIHLIAQDGSSASVPQTSGIALNYTGGTVDGNILLPTTDPAFDAVGYGMRVISDGHGNNDTLVILNLNNVTVTSPPLPPPPGNEEPGNLDPAEAAALGQANDASIRLDAINGGNILFNIDASTVQGPIVATTDFLHPAMDPGVGSAPGSIIGTLNDTLILPSTDGGGNPDAAAIILGATEGGTLDVTFSNMTGARAISGHGAQALAFLATEGTITATFDNVEMTNNLLGDGSVTGPITQAQLTALGVTDLTEADFDNAWDDGVDPGFGVRGVIQGYVAGTDAVVNLNLNDVVVTGNEGAGTHAGPGFKLLVENGGTFNANVTNSTFSGNGPGTDPITGGDPEGEFDVIVRDAGSAVNLNIENTTANGSDGHGFNVVALNGGKIGDATATDFDFLNFTSDPGFDENVDPIVRFNNVTATEAENNGLNIVVADPGSELANMSITNSTFDLAGDDGISIVAENGGTLNEIFINPTTAEDAGRHGLNITTDAASTINGPINITGQPGDPSSFDGAGVNGINIEIGAQMETVDINLEHVTANSAGTPGAPPVIGDGIHITLDNVGNGDTNEISFDGISANGATGDGIHLRLDNGTVADFTTFNNVIAQTNQQNGLLFEVLGGSQLLEFAADGLDVSNNSALSDQHAGLHVRVLGAESEANFDLQNLTINNTVANFGKGVILNVQDEATLGFSVDGGIINNTGREGFEIHVGDTTPGATFNGDFANLDITSGGTAPFADENAFDARVAGTDTTANFTFDNVAVEDFVSGDGFHFQVNGGAALDIEMSNGTTGSGNAGRGFFLLAEGANTTVDLNVFADPGDPVNAFDDNGSHGIEILLQNGDLADPLTANIENLQASANGNDGDGIRVIANDRSGVDIPSIGITADGVNVDGNQGNGLTVDLAEVGEFTEFDLSGMQVSNNVGDQINIRFADMPEDIDFINLSDITATGPGAGTPGPAGSGDGIRLTLDNTVVADFLNLNRIHATNNRRDGLQINLLNGAEIPAGSAIDVPVGSAITDEMRFDDNGRHGININLFDSTAELDILNSSFLFGTTASMSGNQGDGIRIGLEGGSSLTTNMDHLTIDGNQGNGIFIQSTGDSTFDSGTSITNNEITNNNGVGIRGQFLGGDFDLSIGSRTVADQGNVIHNNNGAGIAVRMIQDAEGRIAVIDNQITGTRDTLGGFNGDGFFLEMVGTAVTPPATNRLEDTIDGGPGLLIQGNLIGTDELTDGANLGNAGFGINYNVEEQSVIEGMHIVENAISFNGDGGIEFQRRDFVEVNDFLINTNFIEFNNGHGINLEGRNSATDLMTVTIGEDVNGNPFARSNIVNWMNAFDGNVIRGNTNSGVRAFVMGDANLRVDMQENFIIQNQNNGIQLNENRLSGDEAHLFGTWDRNIVSNNQNRGFVSNARADLLLTDSIVGAVIDQFGDVFNDAQLGLLHGNHSTGVEINGVGSYVLGQFMNQDSGIDILFNGREVTADRTQGHGIDIQGATFKSVEVHNSRILQNFQDGVEIDVAGGFGMDLLFTDNRVTNNVGRGYDVLVRGNTHLDLEILGTIDPRLTGGLGSLATATSNGEEGIYIVSTADTGQSQSDFSTTELSQNGSVINSNPTSNIRVSQVDISFNGNDIPGDNQFRPAGSGLVVRVGTAGGTTSVSDPGGFASTGAAGTPTGRNNSRAGVVMQVDSNHVNGNFGDGMFFHGFRSTGNPSSGTTWNQDTFNPSGYQSDPLARFDLIWGVAGNGTENVFAGGDDLNANNNSVLAPRRGNPDGQAGAFYNNSDGTFKSRLNNIMAPNIAGPFNSATRRRNAQRQALREFPNGDVLNPQVGPGLQFLYPGMGDSVFRVSALSGDNEDLIPTYVAGGLGGFAFDFNSDENGFGSIFAPGDRDGTSFVGSITGEIPFGWGIFGTPTATTAPSGN